MPRVTIHIEKHSDRSSKLRNIAHGYFPGDVVITREDGGFVFEVNSHRADLILDQLEVGLSDPGFQSFPQFQAMSEDQFPLFIGSSDEVPCEPLSEVA
jgi:hypothetical protein